MNGKILIVDDQKEIAEFMSGILSARGFESRSCCDPREALPLVRAFKPDLCILDFQMPFMTGSQVAEHIKDCDPTIGIVFLTGENDIQTAVHAMRKGANDFLNKPVNLAELDSAIARAMEHRRVVLENLKYKAHLEDLVYEQTTALKEALLNLHQMHDSTLDALAMALDFRDQSTAGHSRRVARLTVGIARKIGVPESSCIDIEHGGLLHDIGKLKIPDTILLKPGPLTDAEWVTMRKHPQYGYEFLVNHPFLKNAAELVLSHQEKFDGSGYPRRLKGEAIPVGARVFAIVDTVDALIFDRPYHKAVSLDEAEAEIERCSGTQFDPDLVKPALEFIRRELPAAGGKNAPPRG